MAWGGFPLYPEILQYEQWWLDSNPGLYCLSSLERYEWATKSPHKKNLPELCGKDAELAKGDEVLLVPLAALPGTVQHLKHLHKQALAQVSVMDRSKLIN